MKTEYVYDFLGGPESDLPFRAVASFEAIMRTRVDFYDRRNKGGFSEHGQRICAYHIVTLLDHSAPGTGLNLDGGVDNWTIAAPAFAPLVTWLSMLARYKKAVRAGRVLDQVVRAGQEGDSPLTDIEARVLGAMPQGEQDKNPVMRALISRDFVAVSDTGRVRPTIAGRAALENYNAANWEGVTK